MHMKKRVQTDTYLINTYEAFVFNGSALQGNRDLCKVDQYFGFSVIKYFCLLKD